MLDAGARARRPPLARQFDYEDGGLDGVEGPPRSPATSATACRCGERRWTRSCWSGRARRKREVIERARVREVLWDGERAAGVALEDGRRAHAALVVGADGRHSLVAKQVDAESSTRAAAARPLLPLRRRLPRAGRRPARCRRVLAARRRDRLRLPERRRAHVRGGLVDLETFGWLRRDLGTGCNERIAHHRGLAPRVAAATAPAAWRAAGPSTATSASLRPGMGARRRRGAAPGPVERARHGLAGVHATFLAEAIVDWLRGSADEAAAMAGYHERRDGHGLPGYHETTHYAADLRRSTRDGGRAGRARGRVLGSAAHVTDRIAGCSPGRRA